MNILSILLAVLIFGFLIFIHELGHFVVARLCGVKVLEFAIGMGPKIFSIKSKKSGTAYSLRWIPIGGYVNMLGENGMEAVQGSSDGDQETQTENGAGDEASLEHRDTFFFNVSSNDGEDVQSTDDTRVEYSEEEAKQAYCNQSVWKRILISLAGPVMNLVLGFVLMFGIVIAAGQQNLGKTQVTDFYVVYAADESQMGLVKGDYFDKIDGEIIHSLAQLKEYVAAREGQTFTLDVYRVNSEAKRYEPVTLTDVALSLDLLEKSIINSTSEQSGLCVGDEIIKVNGTRVHTHYELSYEIMNQGYQPIDLTVIRNGERVVLEDIKVPNQVEEGIAMGSVDFYTALEDDFGFGTILKHTWYRSVSMVKMVYDSIVGLFSGRYGMEAVSGPIGITQTISDVAKSGGALNVFALVTIISINLGVMNLLPLPALDGGHLLLYVIEIIRGKPVKKEIEGMINFVGLIIILTLAVLIAIKDIIAL